MILHVKMKRKWPVEVIQGGKSPGKEYVQMSLKQLNEWKQKHWREHRKQVEERIAPPKSSLHPLLIILISILSSLATCAAFHFSKVLF